MLSGRLRSQIRAFDRGAALVTVVMAAGTAAFIPAFKLSSVADVAMIYAAAPLVAAALAWVFIAEVPTGRVMLASVAAFAGVVIILNDSIDAGRLPGNFLALFMTLMMAGAMVIYRKWPRIPVALPTALSSLILLPAAAIFGSPMSAPRHELPILIAFGLVFTVASITLLEGARRLPSADAALVSSLETPLAPLLAFLILSERPSADMVLGGCVIFTAVLWSQRSTAAS